MTRLANTERGLSPHALRQLYLACVTSIADYGSAIWWKGQAQFKRPLQALQNLGLRKILGVFRTAPILPMEAEAALAPPSVRLNTSIRKYAFRALKLAPTHPINQALQSTLLDPDSPDSPDGYTPIQQIGVKPSFSPPVGVKPAFSRLERIKNSISGLVDPDSLESIYHFKYPPWNRGTPYTVEISELPKDEAALVHNEQVRDDQDKLVTTVYTDASATPDGTGIGVGLVVISQGRTTY